MRPTRAAKLVSTASVTSSMWTPSGRSPPVDDEPHERDVHLLLERQIDHAGHACTASRACSPSRRSVRRSSPKILMAMFAACPTACDRYDARSADRSSHLSRAVSKTRAAARRAAPRASACSPADRRRFRRPRRPALLVELRASGSASCGDNLRLARRICSTRLPISSDLASDVPGSVFA